jgi:hypothetical protein
MTIFTQFVWLGGLFLEGIILVRSILGKSFAKYSFFYLYIASVLVTSATLWVIYVYIAKPSLNVAVYWPTQYVTLALGCGVIFEISRHVFAHRVTLDRLARWSMLATFGLIFLLVAVHALLLPNWNVASNTADLERDLRVAQALVLMTIISLTGYYRIEIGKNIRGMILGFGVYVGASILSLTARLFIGARFGEAWQIIQSSAYFAALAIWAFALWSYEPAPRSRPPSDPDGVSGGGYQALADQTQEVLDSINDHLNRPAPR